MKALIIFESYMETFNILKQLQFIYIGFMHTNGLELNTEVLSQHWVISAIINVVLSKNVPVMYLEV